ncbi:MAG TPA: polysaccharide deacetylase family protein [Bacilli bacterium]
MDNRFLWTPVIIISLYMFIPWILTRIFGIGVFRRGHRNGQKRQIAFTFDDGPDPVYTPQLLDLLLKYNIKATFFVLGSKAEAFPDIIRRIHQEGHLIGVHNYTHLSNWLITPWSVIRKQVERSANIIEQITGDRPIYYRPPWGMINLFDFRMRKKFHIILWSVMISDWRSHLKGDEQKLTKKLLASIRDGSVVLLHDSCDNIGSFPHAPFYMLQALESVLSTLTIQGFEYLRVDEMIENKYRTRKQRMGLSKRGLVTIWLLWEKAFVLMFRIVPVDEKNTLFKLRVRQYTGDQVIHFGDGGELRKGDRIAELHLDNELLFKLSSTSRSMMHLTVQLIRRTEELMPQIRQLMQHNPDFHDVKGLYGITLIHRGTPQFGFTVIDLPKGVFSLFTRIYLRLLLLVLHPQGKQRLNSRTDHLVPKIIAISKQELISRYIA